LYSRKDSLTEIAPLCLGGGTIDDVGLDYCKLARSPLKFEAGTPPIAETIGLGAAVDYLERIGMENIEGHERKLAKRAFDELSSIPKLEVYGPEPKRRIGIFPFNVADLNPHDVALLLDQNKIAVRSGHHCALPLHKFLLNKPDGSVRASIYLYNTAEDVDKLAETLSEIVTSFA
jgi:cysteine desulfurase/selenocysteine lyase